MANLKEIRNRIASVGANMKITQAMKMVSASKFKRASDAITHMRPYADNLSEIISQVSASGASEHIQSPYVQTREVKKSLIVVFTSNKGLCGAFNSNIVKRVKSLLASPEFSDKEVDIITIGNKGRELLSKVHPIKGDYSSIYDNLTFSQSSDIAEGIMKSFVDGQYDKIEFVYNKFKNAATQINTVEQFLPLELSSSSDNSIAQPSEFIMEPDSASIIEGLLPQSLRLHFFRVLRDTVASEHGARMTAMHQATDNAKTLKEQLTLSYNNARQSAITNQILEIVNGAEALSSK